MSGTEFHIDGPRIERAKAGLDKPPTVRHEAHDHVSPEWQAVGTPPHTRLLSTIYVDGYPMHLEAVEVEDRDDLQCAVNDDYDCQLDYAAQMNGEGHFDTAEIGGRQYVLMATSYS